MTYPYKRRLTVHKREDDIIKTKTKLSQKNINGASIEQTFSIICGNLFEMIQKQMIHKQMDKVQISLCRNYMHTYILYTHIPQDATPLLQIWF